MHLRILLPFLLVLLAFPARAHAAGELRIGLLPIVDTILLHVAEREGYFREQGLAVELIPFQSALEKDAAVQAGSLDGHFCEISSVILQQASGQPFVVVAVTYYSNPKSRMFGLVTAPGVKATALTDLKGKSVAIARQTIVDFMLDYFLAAAKTPEDFMSRTDIRKIPVRLQMLLANQVDAALVPEPLLSIAEQAGGTVVMDDRNFAMPLAVVALSTRKATPETVRAFQAALHTAAEAINADPARYRKLLLELRLIPPQLADSFRMPFFDLDKVPATLPSRDLFNAYVTWLERNKILAGPPDAQADARAGGSRVLHAPRYEDVIFQDNGRQ